MSDLDELLRQTGAAWQAPSAPPLELGAATRRRTARVRSALAVAAAVALVGAGTVWAALPRGVPAVPVESPTPVQTRATTPAPSETPSETPSSPPPTSAVDPADLARLTEAARNAAVGARGSTPVTAQAVLTTHARAEQALDMGSSPEPSPQTPVWVVELRGVFVCDTCSRPFGAYAPAGTVIHLMTNAETMEGFAFSLTRTPADLAGLGEVLDLDLGPLTAQPFDTPDPETERLADRVRGHLTDGSLGYDDPLSGQAVASTLGQAQQLLFGHTPTPPSGTPVWFAQLQGDFTCTDCTSPGSTQVERGTVLTLVINQATDALELKVLSDEATDFAGFGGVLERELDARALATSPDWQPALASYPRSDPLGVGDAAALDGTLLLVGGCLVVESDTGQVVVPVLPTPAATWSAQHHTLTVGATTLAVGDRVSWGGGYSDAPADSWQVADSCRGMGQGYFQVQSA